MEKLQDPTAYFVQKMQRCTFVYAVILHKPPQDDRPYLMIEAEYRFQ